MRVLFDPGGTSDRATKTILNFFIHRWTLFSHVYELLEQYYF